MWGSNAREAHPIFFHHVLKGIRNGAKMYAVDPRRSTTAQVGGRLARHPRRLRHLAWPTRSPTRSSRPAWPTRSSSGARRSNFEAYKEQVAEYPLERAERDSGVPSGADQAARPRLRQGRPGADLLDARHHRAPQRHRQRARADQPVAAHRARRHATAPGWCRCEGQNNVQGGGDMGAIPNKLTGFQDIALDHDARRRFGEKYGVTIHPKTGMHLSQMFDAMAARRAHLRLRHRREPDELRGGHATTPARCSRAWTAWWSRTSS